MHDTALVNAKKFVNKYIPEGCSGKTILDIGSCDVNGTLKPLFSDGTYIGLDAAPGPNVDIVSSARSMPIDNDSFDVVVSTSCFEHDDRFWLTFLEMCRVLKPKGFLYINAPSAGSHHAYPVDCWRFYLDSWKALEGWGKESGCNIRLLEAYVDPTGDWKDCVGIYTKD